MEPEARQAVLDRPRVQRAADCRRVVCLDKELQTVLRRASRETSLGERGEVGNISHDFVRLARQGPVS